MRFDKRVHPHCRECAATLGFRNPKEHLALPKGCITVHCRQQHLSVLCCGCYWSNFCLFDGKERVISFTFAFLCSLKTSGTCPVNYPVLLSFDVIISVLCPFFYWIFLFLRNLFGILDTLLFTVNLETFSCVLRGH